MKDDRRAVRDNCRSFPFTNVRSAETLVLSQLQPPRAAWGSFRHSPFAIRHASDALASVAVPLVYLRRLLRQVAMVAERADQLVLGVAQLPRDHELLLALGARRPPEPHPAAHRAPPFAAAAAFTGSSHSSSFMRSIADWGTLSFVGNAMCVGRVASMMTRAAPIARGSLVARRFSMTLMSRFGSTWKLTAHSTSSSLNTSTVSSTTTTALRFGTCASACRPAVFAWPSSVFLIET